MKKYIKLTKVQVSSYGDISKDEILLNVDLVLYFKPIGCNNNVKSAAYFTYGESLGFAESFDEIQSLIEGLN